ncbi:MAG: flagellar basal body rod protein FlgB [Solirubrobacteraceae bacterium]|nr:flagellar basal body rod protein FlgB [Solirubrobacteraceae bacterium]
MDLFDSTHQLLEGALRGAAARHTALSANIANANTPGYRRVDVDFHAALREAAGDDPDAVAELEFTPAAEPGVMQVDGNGVDIDVEAAELAANGLEYQALVAVMAGRCSILQSAIGTR